MKKPLWRELAVALAAVAIIALVAGCSPGAEPKAAPDSAPAESAKQAPATQEPATQPGVVAEQTIEISDSGFTPAELKVSAGTKVTWKNVGSKDHNVTFFIDSRTLGVMKPGENGSVLFNTPGQYAYADAYNSELTGIVIVE